MGPGCIPEINETLGIKLIRHTFNGNKITVLVVKIKDDARHGFNIVSPAGFAFFIDIERKLMSFLLAIFFCNHRGKVGREECTRLFHGKRPQDRWDLFKPLKEADMD